MDTIYNMGEQRSYHDEVEGAEVKHRSFVHGVKSAWRKADLDRQSVILMMK